MLLGYNTNGFAFHRLHDAIEIIAGIGYRAVGLTLDFHSLNPYSDDLDDQVSSVGGQLQHLQLRSVIETGARFLLDPRRKHQPTLISPTPDERSRRIDFLCRSIVIASRLGSDAVSFWSGAAVDDVPPSELSQRFVESIKPVLDCAETHNVVLALEPEPGMLLDTVEATRRLVDELNHPLLQWTIDVGHLHCQQEGSIPEILHSVAGKLANIHIEDMRQGVHDHLMFGEGEMDFAPILRTLDEMGYRNGVYVELSRHAHNAVASARQAYEFLTQCDA